MRCQAVSRVSRAVRLFAVWLLLGTPAFAGQTDLTAKIGNLVAGAKPGTLRLGIHVVDLRSGKTIYEHNADEALKPASNMKLVTMGAALDMLPAGFKYRTMLAMRGNDLVVLGTGDPSVGDPQLARTRGEPITAIFHRWAAGLRERGIQEIEGDLIIDDTVFEARRLHPNWPPKEHQTWYSAPVGGLNFNDNCIDVTLRPAGKGAEPTITVVPANTYVTIRNETRPGDKLALGIRRVGDDPVYVVYGNSGNGGTLKSVAVPDPGLFFAAVCRTSLAAKGIRIRGQIRRERIRDDRGNLPPTCTVLAVYERDLNDILPRIGKDSQNLFAECLLKTLAFQMSARDTGVGVGSYEVARKYIRTFLEKAQAPLTPDLCFDDGSGFSHKNRLTARLLTHVLQYMARHPRGSEFVGSLAVSGQDGTLEKRLTDIKGMIRAKTGYITGVHALSGYARSQSGRLYCFSILCNSPGGSSPARRLQDDICRALVKCQPAETKTAGNH